MGPVQFNITPRADNFLIFDASVELESAAPVYVEYGNDQVGWLRTPTTPALPSQQLALVHLRSRTAYQARAFTIDESECRLLIATSRFKTEEVPELRELKIRLEGRLGSPLTVIDYHLNSVDGVAVGLVALDQTGQPVWYHRIPRALLRETGSKPAGLTRLANGNYLQLIRNYGFEEITPDARTVRSYHFTSGPGTRTSHDLMQLPDGRVLFIGAESRMVDDSINGGQPDTLVRGDVLSALDLENGEAAPVWSAFDLLDPTQRPSHWQVTRDDHESDMSVLDWTHANSLFPGDHGNILVSFRQLDQIVSLSPDLRSIEWRLGGPGSNFSFATDAARFQGQHTVSQLANGNILMFDNGNFRPDGEYSRGLELALDFQTMTARQVWEYRHELDVFASRTGSAYRLPNGNTLVNFGFPEAPNDPLIIVEARPDGSVGAEMSLRQVGQRSIAYRAYALATLAGELPVDPGTVNYR